MKKFILHLGFENDSRFPKNLFHYQNDFKMIKKLHDFKFDDVHIKAPLSLKTRIQLYKDLKHNSDASVIIKLYPLTLSDYQKLDELNSKYTDLQVPIIGVDCDIIELAEGTKSLISEVVKERSKNPDMDNHDTPHHKETISDHIMLVSNEIMNYLLDNKDVITNNDFYITRDVLYSSALYHDLGKYWTKVFDESKGYYRYFGHENVSALMYLTEKLLKLSPEDFKNQQDVIRPTTQIILNHMFAKTDGYHKKAIKRKQLTDFEQEMLEVFIKADNKGRLR